ncbi:oxidoreductase [Photobacterium aquae]|uniref:Oxidoreductase n=1 Tax=Photobacterium aquae TaxID=1195763 RepID=A0A0J1GX72_9GAMM|nr:FAD-dependent oxidoreductase [Photobacterium aquae]KLV04263.1 oxidoreductase [Photobacterium aquae]
MKNHGLPITTTPSRLKVGVIGGGIAGSTIALRLAEQGINVALFEEGTSLVNGPPICHLHAGGNLYREISNEQCVTLLKQSIDSLRVFPHTVNVRPTVIAVPSHDHGEPSDLIPRLELLRNTYQQMVNENIANKMIGEPEQYFTLYSKEKLCNLARREIPSAPATLDDWMIPVAKHIDLDKFKFPLILVQEYGWSIFRLAASASLALEQLASSEVFTSTKVTNLEQTGNGGWNIHYQYYDPTAQDHITQEMPVDFIVNACGYQTGTIDNYANLQRQRLVEFKAAYVTRWPDCNAVWPEVIFHGERSTPQGMAQLTPYPDGYFQLHGMTNDITLFKNGLVSSSKLSAQPELDTTFTEKLRHGWQKTEADMRSQRAIEHMSQFVPAYQSAMPSGEPLFGAQQIPGSDVTLRAADISFDGNGYARTEIVKGSSALSAADGLIRHFVAQGWIEDSADSNEREQQFPVALSFDELAIEEKAKALAVLRGYPTALAATYSFPTKS